MCSGWIVAYPDRTYFRGYLRFGGHPPRITGSDAMACIGVVPFAHIVAEETILHLPGRADFSASRISNQSTVASFASAVSPWSMSFSENCAFLDTGLKFKKTSASSFPSPIKIFIAVQFPVGLAENPPPPA